MKRKTQSKDVFYSEFKTTRNCAESILYAQAKHMWMPNTCDRDVWPIIVEYAFLPQRIRYVIKLFVLKH